MYIVFVEMGRYGDTWSEEAYNARIEYYPTDSLLEVKVRSLIFLNVNWLRVM